MEMEMEMELSRHLPMLTLPTWFYYLIWFHVTGVKSPLCRSVPTRCLLAPRLALLEPICQIIAHLRTSSA